MERSPGVTNQQNNQQVDTCPCWDTLLMELNLRTLIARTLEMALHSIGGDSCVPICFLYPYWAQYAHHTRCTFLWFNNIHWQRWNLFVPQPLLGAPLQIYSPSQLVGFSHGMDHVAPLPIHMERRESQKCDACGVSYTPPVCPSSDRSHSTQAPASACLPHPCKAKGTCLSRGDMPWSPPLYPGSAILSGHMLPHCPQIEHTCHPFQKTSGTWEML